MLSMLLSFWMVLFPADDVKEIKHIFHVQQQAVQTNNLAQYLSTLYDDEHYKQEQKRWFEDAVTFIDPKSFHIKVKSYRLISKDHYHVEIVQSYRKSHQLHVLKRPVEIKKTKQGWKDADSLFYEKKKNSIIVKYSDANLETQAETALSILSHVSKVMGDKYLWRPSVTEVKLYQDPEIFRHSVKLSLPSWTGGWNEAKQSIKLIAGKADVLSLIHGLAHEYTHQLVSHLTNDNAAYWLQEGAAMFYEAWISKEEPAIEKGFHPYTIKQLEKMNLEQLSDEEASQYYVSCFVRFKEMVQQHGEKRIRQALKEIGHYPYIDKDSVWKQRETNERTYHILQKHRLLSNKMEDAYLHTSWKELL